MIIDIPTAEDFAQTSLNLLMLAWSIAIDLERKREDIDKGIEDNVIYAAGDVSLLEEFREAHNIHYQRSQPALSNCLALIQQAIEMAIKGKIAAVSPYLLIVRDNREYPKVSDGDVSFSEFRSIDATELIRFHNLVSSSKLDDNFRDFCEKIRKQRNKIMHTAGGRKEFNVPEIISHILKVYAEFFADTAFAQRCLQFYRDGDTFSIFYGRDLSYGNALDDIFRAVQLLPVSEAKIRFGFNRKKRAYICPHCYDQVDSKYQTETIPELAQLEPISPDSTVVYCFVCGIKSPVVRQRCSGPDCKSNVLSDEDRTAGLCLVCGRYNQDLDM